MAGRAPVVLVWDDELDAATVASPFFRVVCRAHADAWADDLRDAAPDVVLVDNDMGDDHLQGWEVLAELRRERPDLVVFAVSRNLPAMLRMVLDGALPVAKERIPELLRELEAAWSDGAGAGGAPWLARCRSLACVDRRLLSFARPR